MHYHHHLQPRPAASLVLALAAVFVLAPPPSAHADRYELTLELRPTGGKSRIADDGTTDRAYVRSRGLAAGARWGVRDWLDIGGEFTAAELDEARYGMATLPISVNLRTGPLRRITRQAQLRGAATFRFGVAWVPFIQLALGLGVRDRFSAILLTDTAQGELWLFPDDQGRELSFDIVTGARAGLERRLTRHWTTGVSAAASHATGIFTPDLQTVEITLSLSYAWYPRFRF